MGSSNTHMVSAEDEPLRNPEEIIEAVNASQTTGDHSVIHKVLNQKQITLRSKIIEKKKSRTVLKKLLQDCVNGDKVVEKQLDRSVSQIGASKDCLDYGTQISFEGISEDAKHGSQRQMRAVRELLDLRACAEGAQRDAYTRLISHPVIATFIHLKWNRTKLFFYINSLIFAIFLAIFSLYIFHLFSQPDEKLCRADTLVARINFPSASPQTKSECSESKVLARDNFFKKLHDEGAPIYTQWDQALLSIFLAILVGFEVYQSYVLRMQYLMELENYVEWFVFISAFVTIVMKQNMVDVTVANSTAIRGVAAAGICAAYLELVFIIGRYPFFGGDFSVMYYNIIKKTFRYVIAMGLIVVGFAFAFMVVNFGLDGDIFGNPLKSIMTTLTMVLGEFNFGDMYDTFKDDTISRGFAMGFLLFMIILGTITMINLFIAVIISDVDKLQNDVFYQNLVNMAANSIQVEALLPQNLLGRIEVKESVQLCGHTLCPSTCRGLRLQEVQAIAHINKEINKVLKRKEQDK